MRPHGSIGDGKLSMVKVLFVCMGNICRSPMAEAVFRHMVNEAGLGKEIEADSAGTSRWEVGSPAHPGTIKVLLKHHISHQGHARQIQRSDLDEHDYVLAMDRENLSFILRYATGARAEIRLFLSYAKEAGLIPIDEVPDPYYDDNFERTYDLVTAGCKALLDHIRQAEGV